MEKTEKKVKRLSLIVKGIGTMVDRVCAVTEHKINRAVDSAIDSAIEDEEDAKSESEKIMDTLGECANNSEKLKDAIQKYCDACDKEEQCKRYQGYLKNLKNALNEEVPVPEGK